MKIGAKIMAENKLQEFINNVQSTEMNLTLSNYVNTRPEIRNEHPEAFRLLPHCAYKYTMIELIECLNDI